MTREQITTADPGPVEHSPLQRDPEQPPCSASAEALCLRGLFAVPDRLPAYDLTPHLWFNEHKVIYRAMLRAATGDQDETLWWRTYLSLAESMPGDQAMRLLNVLEWTGAPVGEDENGELLFVLALTKLERCTDARRRLNAIQDEVTRLWRLPDVPYSAEEKRRMLAQRTATLTLADKVLPV